MLRLALLLLLPAFAFAQGPFPQPKTYPPDAATLAKIEAKTEELRKAVEGLFVAASKARRAEVEVYLKAAEWIVRHNEWLAAKSGQQTVEILDAGLKRAEALKAGKTPWLDVRGKPVALGYFSEVDGSVQPYSLLFPADFDPKKKYRLDIVLHGRDGTLTEVKFLHAKEFAKAGKAPDHFVLEVYGRGNNAYRWAGETDVLEAHSAAVDRANYPAGERWLPSIDFRRVFLRGFSMGGAGTWHLGLHHPDAFAAISPGAGFTTTHGYIGKLPKVLPDYQEKCLRIYDAVNYAENVFNVPVIAYSGEIDKQKLAADNIENALKGFKEPHSFTHLIAPGLEHKQPPEWLKKIDDEFRKLEGKKPHFPERVRFVTFTLAYPGTAWVWITGLDAHYERSVVDATWTEKALTATTTNVRALDLRDGLYKRSVPKTIHIDGQEVAVPDRDGERPTGVELEKVNGKWQLAGRKADWPPTKTARRQGPIDDAYRSEFTVVAASGKPHHDGIGAFTTARQTQFVRLWDKWFRGKLELHPGDKPLLESDLANHVLFGDPQSNPAIAKVLPKLPIKWTKDELVVNGVKYDPATHVPVLIYPNPTGPGYIVLNSGHTFGEADLRGTNALLYPRLGDWAVLKPTPTKADPAAFEVVAAGLFDENWQFPKK